MGRVPSFDPTQPQGPWMRALSWTARQRPVTWFLVNIGNRIDPYLMRASGGRLKTTFAYFTDGKDVVLIASAGGAPKHPAWYRNAMANPEVEVWSHGSGGRYRAQEAEGADRERLWNLAVDYYPGFAKYQERATDRVIPVVVCSPLEG